MDGGLPDHTLLANLVPSGFELGLDEAEDLAASEQTEAVQADTETAGENQDGDVSAADTDTEAERSVPPKEACRWKVPEA